MTITRAEVLADYRASLGSATSEFHAGADADLLRHLRVACAAVALKRRAVVHAALSWYVGGTVYQPVPDELVRVEGVDWPGPEAFNPGAGIAYPPPPRLTVGQTPAGRALIVAPFPTAAHLAASPTLAYQYTRAYVLAETAEDTTLPDSDRDLVVLRAQVEAMRELALRSHQKPVQMRGMQSNNMQPSALYEKLLAEFRAAA